MTFSLSEEEWSSVIKIGCRGETDLRAFAAEGIYRGGEEFVNNHLGITHVLPLDIEQIIKAGINALSSDIIKLHSAKEIAVCIKEALENKQGYSIIRMGDGELVSLAHDLLISTDELNNDSRFNFLSYSGITIPDHSSRDTLAKNVLKADVIGIPLARYPTFQCLFNKIAKYYKWPLHTMCLSSSNIQTELNNETTLFHELMSEYKILLIGNRMNEAKNLFNYWGYDSIVGTIPVNGIESVSSVLDAVQQYEFDVAIVSAGIPANLICVALAEQNKVAIDFGHLTDMLLRGHAVIRKV
ncbi:hypothetical protein EHS13_17425 [Paenibacillus psychroresistens]|uniref:GT-D fold-like domain-containing protein n=1 Tax=Paenibacillus psychroresistens TaxID=1778678 RepID=A0A6B8RKH5_9BACL|nr:GT-D fold domain-containing glycosyltransferase [Paenibacillus psychroresistens]QGQ96539.1 hypothetical protein EHS13_17425 [Paenibacillus psychroresistens]